LFGEKSISRWEAEKVSRAIAPSIKTKTPDFGPPPPTTPEQKKRKKRKEKKKKKKKNKKKKNNREWHNNGREEREGARRCREEGAMEKGYSISFKALEKVDHHLKEPRGKKTERRPSCVLNTGSKRRLQRI